MRVPRGARNDALAGYSLVPLTLPTQRTQCGGGARSALNSSFVGARSRVIGVERAVVWTRPRGPSILIWATGFQLEPVPRSPPRQLSLPRPLTCTSTTTVPCGCVVSTSPALFHTHISGLEPGRDHDLPRSPGLSSAAFIEHPQALLRRRNGITKQSSTRGLEQCEQRDNDFATPGTTLLRYYDG